MAAFLKSKLDLRKATVLEIGCNVGAVALGFAEASRAVYCGDISKKELAILKERISKKKLKNISVQVFNAISLPYRSGAFDLVILNGVLEWVAEVNRDDPEQTQQKVLDEARRVLRPGGLLYLAIENRHYIKRFLGQTAHHDPPFTTILPRPLASLVSRILTGKPYRTYIYGFYSYKKLLRECQFKRVKFYTALPTYVYPEHIIDINNKGRLKKALREVHLDQFSRACGLIMASAGLYKFLGPNFVILAR